MEEKKEKVKNTPQKKDDFIFAVGRRKEAVARIRLYTTLKNDLVWNDVPVKKGDILVNEKQISEYFPSQVMRYIYSEPFRVTNTQNKYTLTIRVVGGGLSGQLDAVVLGIAKALAKLDTAQHRPTLKKKGFLTRDARVRERRKVGMGGKSRRKKQSPKR